MRRSPTLVEGWLAGSLSWKGILKGVCPAHRVRDMQGCLLEGLLCVARTKTRTRAFLVEDAGPKLQHNLAFMPEAPSTYFGFIAFTPCLVLTLSLTILSPQ